MEAWRGMDGPRHLLVQEATAPGLCGSKKRRPQALQSRKQREANGKQREREAMRSNGNGKQQPSLKAASVIIAAIPRQHIIVLKIGRARGSRPSSKKQMLKRHERTD